MKRAIVAAVLVAICSAGAAGAQDSIGDLRVLVIRATWGPAPDDSAALSAAAPFYDRASFGQLRLHLEITPWLAAYNGPVCPSDGEAAKAAANAAGYDVATGSTSTATRSARWATAVDRSRRAARQGET